MPRFTIPALSVLAEGMQSGPGLGVCSFEVRGTVLTPSQVCDLSPEGTQGPQAPLGAGTEEQGPRGHWLRVTVTLAVTCPRPRRGTWGSHSLRVRSWLAPTLATIRPRPAHPRRASWVFGGPCSFPAILSHTPVTSLGVKDHTIRQDATWFGATSTLLLEAETRAETRGAEPAGLLTRTASHSRPPPGPPTPGPGSQVLPALLLA